MKNGLRVLMLLLLIAGVFACGNMSDPSAFEGSGYPHSYPRR